MMVAPPISEPPGQIDPLPGRLPMDRVRTGVTGLAFILLVVALATAIASGVRRTANASATAAVPTANVSNAKPEKTDPLGQLGVTPPVEQGGAANAPNGAAPR
jgi:hypothetical protein